MGGGGRKEGVGRRRRWVGLRMSFFCFTWPLLGTRPNVAKVAPEPLLGPRQGSFHSSREALSNKEVSDYSGR